MPALPFITSFRPLKKKALALYAGWSILGLYLYDQRKQLMMKKFYPLFLILFFINALNAQPIISEGIIPEIGDEWRVTFLETNNFAPGLGGVDMLWDFSNIDTSMAIGINMKIVDPAMISDGPNFPTADFVWWLQEFDAYNYYEVTDDSVSLVGGATIANGEIDFLTTFIDPEDGLHLPLEHGDSYTYYSFFDQTVIGIPIGTNERTGMVVADAYGTLITPKGTYENILRLVITETSFGFTSTQYAWYDVNNFVPVFLYESSDDPELTPSLYFSDPKMNTTATTNIFEELPTWKTWYNTAEQALHVEWPDLEESVETKIRVFTMDGQLIKTDETDFTFGKHQISLPKQPNLSSVIVNLEVGQQQASRKVLIF